MKKFNLSLVAAMALGSTMLMAGGDITPVEPMVEVPVVMEVMNDDSGFYLGLGYGWQGLELEDTTGVNPTFDENFGSIMIDAGYKFNQYVAVEGRYWYGLSSSNDLGWTGGWGNSDITVDSWAIYVKPMYPVTDAVNIYALLGYGSTDVDYDAGSNATVTVDSADGFSWGLGVDYSFTENVSMFVDYTSVVNAEVVNVAAFDTIEETLNNVNIGVNYKF